jgi:hypothetical protein
MMPSVPKRLIAAHHYLAYPQMLAKQTKRIAVVDARAGVAQAVEKVAAEKRLQAEEERCIQVCSLSGTLV